MSDKQELTLYEAGMLDERAHQNALSRLAMKKHQEEVDALKAELTRLRESLQASEGRRDELRQLVCDLRAQLELSMKETGDLRQAITEAVEMPWDEMPQPLGGMGYACPDDVRIVEFVANLREQLAEARQWETCDIETKPKIITRAQFRLIEAVDYRIQRRKEGAGR